MSHLGRPQEGQATAALSLAPVSARLSDLLGKPVPLRKDWLDGVDCAPGSAVLCENVRFNKGEKEDDEQLARAHGGAVRSVRHGRLRHRAPRRGQHPRSGALRAGGVRRSLAGGRTGGAGARAAETRPAAGGDRRRREDLDQAHGARVAAGEGRPADRRRRHRQHLPRRHRRGRRQVAVRDADAGCGATPHGQGARARHRDPAADGCRGGQGIRGHRARGRARGGRCRAAAR